MEEKIQEILTKTARIQFGSDCVFRVTFLRNSKVTIEALKENHEVFVQLAGNEAYPFIFEAEENVNLTAEAQQHATTMSAGNMLVIAVVVNNFLYRLLAEFYYGKNKPPVPYKVFSNSEDAENWIKLYS